VIPAVGYGPAQLEALRATLAAAEVDVVISATPCDLAALIPIDKPVLRARYEFAEAGTPGLGEQIDAFMRARGLGRP
jgi:predicted GTPase